nr:hypothetical protein [Tanacetum cinerariifolium]
LVSGFDAVTVAFAYTFRGTLAGYLDVVVGLCEDES